MAPRSNVKWLVPFRSFCPPRVHCVLAQLCVSRARIERRKGRDERVFSCTSASPTAPCLRFHNFSLAPTRSFLSAPLTTGFHLRNARTCCASDLVCLVPRTPESPQVRGISRKARRAPKKPTRLSRIRSKTIPFAAACFLRSFLCAEKPASERTVFFSSPIRSDPLRANSPWSEKGRPLSNEFSRSGISW